MSVELENLRQENKELRQQIIDLKGELFEVRDLKVKDLMVKELQKKVDAATSAFECLSDIDKALKTLEPRVENDEYAACLRQMQSYIAAVFKRG